ncbi:uncharacterized protein LOC120267338 [Dioscorea cayenensis subsp. rotundata]|uniref:Uncharacterized protein LOC120267338 n=1 Tax=Dioscorea cayennensis subsp. rotundata TaxID=55577 RepID=A0AB40BU02_DIOCR|nr:uncharacterized protein LOC120267338 [Dioscorea cayenensis subsp. rotundata]
MSRYAKFLKELLTNKKKLEEVATVTLSKECSTIISNKIPKKEKDRGGFIIPCTIKGMLDKEALANLGANLDDKAKVALIIGFPFLVTSQGLIDVKDDQIVLRVGDEEVVFKLKDVMRHSMDDDDLCYALDVIDDCVVDFV